MTFQKTIVKQFRTSSIKSELEDIKKVEFRRIFICYQFFKYERNMREYARICEYSLTFPYLKQLETVDPPFVTITKLLSNNIGKIFSEGLK